MTPIQAELYYYDTTSNSVFRGRNIILTEASFCVGRFSLASKVQLIIEQPNSRDTSSLTFKKKITRERDAYSVAQRRCCWVGWYSWPLASCYMSVKIVIVTERLIREIFLHLCCVIGFNFATHECFMCLVSSEAVGFYSVPSSVNVQRLKPRIKYLDAVTDDILALSSAMTLNCATVMEYLL